MVGLVDFVFFLLTAGSSGLSGLIPVGTVVWECGGIWRAARLLSLLTGPAQFLDN